LRDSLTFPVLLDGTAASASSAIWKTSRFALDVHTDAQKLFAPAAPEAPDPTVSARFDEATLRLARLIGRQIAREEFERRHQSKNAKEAAEIKKRGKSP
jgi:hypothetical protein